MSIQNDKTSQSYDDLIIPTEDQASTVLKRMQDQIEIYGAATVADFFDLLGVTATFEDATRGWKDLDGVQIRSVYAGYLIDLPRAINLR